jgi:hypothetical protein
MRHSTSSRGLVDAIRLRGSGGKAQALVELVLAMPLVMGLVCAVLHFGIMCTLQGQLDAGLRAAAMFAAYHPEDDAAILAAMKSALPDFVGSDEIEMTATTPGTRSRGDALILTVRCRILLLEALPMASFLNVPCAIGARTTTCILVGNGP